MDVIFVHGYNVTSTKTYGQLPRRLKAYGHQVKDVYLSKYVTLDDDITIPDLARALDVALRDVYKTQYGKREFACITHSTGALVVRAWIERFYSAKIEDLPLTHLIMLAPPNHGSRLATLGKSRLSRLRSIVGIEPGLKILDALEIGSDFQWNLDTQWFAAKRQVTKDFYPFVVAGQWIDKKLWDVIVPATYERGSDGVVRVPSANLNTRRYRLAADGSVGVDSIEGVPFLVAPKSSHSDTRYGIVGSIPVKGFHPVFDAIAKALAVTSRETYNQLESEWRTATTRTQKEETYYDGSRLDRYCQVVFRVIDNMGNRLSDYAIELVDGDGRGDQLPSGFMGGTNQGEANPEYFTFFLNFDRISQVKGGKLGFRVQSAPNSPLVAYSQVTWVDDLTDVEEILRPNETTYVEIELRRRLNKNVFRLTDDLSEQKIKGQPGPDWID